MFAVILLFAVFNSVKVRCRINRVFEHLNKRNSIQVVQYRELLLEGDITAYLKILFYSLKTFGVVLNKNKTSLRNCSSLLSIFLIMSHK